MTDLGDETMTVQKVFPRTNPIEASANPGVMTTAQADEALRDFVLQDTAHLRRDAEEPTQGNLRRELESATEVATDVNSLVRQVADISLNQMDDVIVDLRNLRDFLHSEGERVRREISGFLQLNQAAMGSTRIIADGIAQWKESAGCAARPRGKEPAETERSDVAATPSVPPPS
jgi:hypothetical protein